MKDLRLIAGLFTAAGLVITEASASPITALAFTADGAELVIGCGSFLRVHQVAKGKLLWEYDFSPGRIQDLNFSPDGKHLAISGGLPGQSGQVRLLSWPEVKPMGEVKGFGDTATAIAFNPRGGQVAMASANRTVAVHAFRRGRLDPKPIYHLVNHSRAVLDVAYDPEGRYLVTASADRSLKVWDAASGRLIRSLGNHTEIVNALAVRPPLRYGDQVLPFYCASASDDRTVRIWQPGIGRMVRIIRHHDAEINAMAWNPSGDRLYSADRAGVVRVIDAGSDRVVGLWPAHDDWIYRLVTDKDGSRIATCDWRGVVKIWEERDGRATLIRTITGR